MKLRNDDDDLVPTMFCAISEMRRSGPAEIHVVLDASVKAPFPREKPAGL
jgi:hypothetical protein